MFPLINIKKDCVNKHHGSETAAWRVKIKKKKKKKTFLQNSEKCGNCFIKSGIMSMYLPFICNPPSIDLILSKSVMLNITMYILTILACSLKINVIGVQIFKTQTSFNPKFQ